MGFTEIKGFSLNWKGYNQRFLKFLYDEVIKNNPTTILEFGTGFGYTTCAMAMALKHLNNGGKIHTYDSYTPNRIWKIKSSKDIVYSNLSKYGVNDFVVLNKINDINDWFSSPFKFDMAFVDIDNNADKLNPIFNNPYFKNSFKSGSDIYFCGGTEERDNINRIRGEKPISSVDCNIECVHGKPSPSFPLGEKGCIAKIKNYKDE